MEWQEELEKEHFWKDEEVISEQKAGSRRRRKLESLLITMSDVTVGIKCDGTEWYGKSCNVHYLRFTLWQHQSRDGASAAANGRVELYLLCSSVVFIIAVNKGCCRCRGISVLHIKGAQTAHTGTCEYVCAAL